MMKSTVEENRRNWKQKRADLTRNRNNGRTHLSHELKISSSEVQCRKAKGKE